jgi:hypothetical protein
MVEPPFMTDELVEVSGKSGPHVVWRPGTNGELVVAAPCGGLPFEVPYQDVKRWKSETEVQRKLLPPGSIPRQIYKSGSNSRGDSD